jgi:hypothetical protein
MTIAATAWPVSPRCARHEPDKMAEYKWPFASEPLVFGRLAGSSGPP